MKFKCGLTEEEYEDRMKAERLKILATPWKRWFAIWPVKVAETDCRWLEWVEYNYDYRDFPKLDRVIVTGWKYRHLLSTYSLYTRDE